MSQNTHKLIRPGRDNIRTVAAKLGEPDFVRMRKLNASAPVFAFQAFTNLSVEAVKNQGSVCAKNGGVDLIPWQGNLSLLEGMRVPNLKDFAS